MVVEDHVYESAVRGRREFRAAMVREQTERRATLTRIYDILARINDEVEVGDDGYARFGSLNDRDRFRELVQELEPDALAFHNEQSADTDNSLPAKGDE